MAIVDKVYHNLLQSIIDKGYEYETENRPGIVCKQLSSVTLDIPLNTEFPLLTTKQMFIRGIVAELIWFLRGESNIKYLLDNNVDIWTKDALTFLKQRNGDEPKISEFREKVKDRFYSGDVGRNYGVQWRNWTQIGEAEFDELVPVSDFDQIDNLIHNLRQENPINRRHIVTAWNPAELDNTALPPCHWAFEIIVRPLDTSPYYGFYLKWHQRSVDTFLGLPFNIASYAILAYIIGEMTGLQPLGLIGDLSNVHIYEPHFEVVEEQLTRNTETFNGCQLDFSEKGLKTFSQFNNGEIGINDTFASLQISDFIFNNYESYPALKAEMFEQTNN
jgi:thymidylate synthase